MQNDVAIRESYGVVNFEESAMNVESVTRQVAIIQNVMKSVMKQDEHYGTIPGTNKPSLLKPGAEKLNLVFRLRPEYQITKTELYSGHREYEVVCTLYHIPTGQSVGQGVGSATTMEGKYRFRGGEKKDTGKPVPKDYWNLKKTDPAKAKELIGGDGFGTAKFDGEWRICELGEKIEHDNPADYYNTVLKMAKKRAHVDAILTATAASDIFTQDTEDMTEVIPGAAEVKKESKPPLQEPQKKSGNGEQKPQMKDPDAPCSEAQTKAIFAMCGKLGIKDDFEVHKKASRLAGIPGDEVVTSLKDLTKGQASSVIDTLNKELDK
jgi:hypothetical protein